MNLDIPDLDKSLLEVRDNFEGVVSGKEESNIIMFTLNVNMSLFWGGDNQTNQCCFVFLLLTALFVEGKVIRYLCLITQF